MLEERKHGSSRYSGVNTYSGLIFCGECGGAYGSKVWHSTDKYRKVVWQCNRKYAKSKCNCPHLTEPQIQAAFLKAFSHLSSQKEDLFKAFEAIKESVFNTTSLQDELDIVNAEISGTEKLLNNLIQQNASYAQDQQEYSQRYSTICNRIKELSEQAAQLQSKIADKTNRRTLVEEFFKTLMEQPCFLTEFDPITFRILLDRIIVNKDSNLSFIFKDGTEITV